MRVLVNCEFSGVVRDAFIRAGHRAWSCDIEATEVDGPHLRMDAIDAANLPGWDLMLAFPPCTDLAVSGARYFKAKGPRRQLDAIMFVRALLAAPIPRIAVENPIGILSSVIARPDQIVQPWMFGHGETKATCLWLKGLPKLEATEIVDGREPRVHFMSPGPNRGRERSRTLPGFAAAMASQWGV